MLTQQGPPTPAGSSSAGTPAPKAKSLKMIPMFITKPKKQPPPQARQPLPSRTALLKPTAKSSRASSSTTPPPPKQLLQRTSSKTEFKEEVNTAGKYTEYKIFSVDLEGSKYNGFKFDDRKKVSVLSMERPIKLNRKLPPGRSEEVEGNIHVQLTPMLGADGKPVIGMDGHVVMVGPDGKPAAQHARQKNVQVTVEKDTKGKRKPFQKKTKQIYEASDLDRQLRDERRFPWILEAGGGGKETWIGHLDDASKSDTHAFLMPVEDGKKFFFVPSHRWWLLQKRPSYATLGLEEAEERLAKFQKSKNPSYWFMHNKGKEGMSAATAATLAKAENIGSSLAMPGSSGSLGPGGRRLKTVDAGQKSKFEQDDEFGDNFHNKRHNAERDGEGDMDEMEFEDDFADDDEAGGGVDAIDDDEAKELEERLKRDLRAAEKEADGSDDEDDDAMKLTGAGKDMRKLVKRLDKSAAGDDSDKEENPYASDVESDEEEETPEVTPQPQPQPPQPAVNGTQATNGTQSSSTHTQAPAPIPKSNSNPPSRATSPGLGNVVVAKRATSPKPPRMNSGSGLRNVGSRASSPLAEGARSRAVSPSAGGMGGIGSPAGSRANSPPLAGAKRKSDSMDGGAMNPKPKKIPKPIQPLTDEMLVAWLKSAPDLTTKACTVQFKQYLSAVESKNDFTARLKKLSKLVNGKLELRAGAGQARMAASPEAPSPRPGSP